MLYVQKFTIEGAKKKLASRIKADKSDQPEFNFVDDSASKKKYIKDALKDLKDKTDRLNTRLSQALNGTDNEA
jgi:hypothetical protein